MDYLNVYTNTFSDNTYSNHDHVQYSLGIHAISEHFKNDSTFKLIDIGSGRGQLLNNIRSSYPNARITSVDLQKFHNNPSSYDEFISCNLSLKTDRDNIVDKYDILTCTDVFEHLDLSFIEDVVAKCAELAPYSFLAIANHSDIWNGVELHTIQKDTEWWSSLLSKYYKINSYESKSNGALMVFRCKSLAID